MSKENLNKFVNSLEKGDNLDAKKAFNDAMSNKISSALDNHKQDVARSMFTGVVGVKAPEANVFTGNNVSDGNATIGDIAAAEVAAGGESSGEVSQ